MDGPHQLVSEQVFFYYLIKLLVKGRWQKYKRQDEGVAEVYEEEEEMKD